MVNDMKTAFLFPGQGSQAKGMGAELFERFPALTRDADEILGYSIRDLCMHDRDGRLGQTECTQPALFVVNALSFLARDERPDYVMGHSLGEYNALHAAGAISFTDGLRLVQRRGHLMSKARNGAMSAILGIEEAEVRRVLGEHGVRDVVVANLNAPTQIVIAGPVKSVAETNAIFERETSATVIALRVSGAFHSPLMAEAAEHFRTFSNSFEFEIPRIAVIANVTGRPYGDASIPDMLTRQITHPVRWSEGIRWLWGKGVEAFLEVGPGRVLTGLVARIKRDAEPINESDTSAMSTPTRSGAFNRPVEPKVVFMYAGQGAHYYNMGRELYERDATFRRTMNGLSARLHGDLQVSLTSVLYDRSKRLSVFDDITYTNPAIFCVQYALTQVLRERGLVPDAVLGSSLGELVAAVVAGVLTVDDALHVVVRMAKWFGTNRHDIEPGGMMVILEKMRAIRDRRALFRECTVAGENYDGNFILSGTKGELERVSRVLDERGVTSAILPVAYAFHSRWIDAYERDFLGLTGDLHFRPARIPMYSAAATSAVENYSGRHAWQAIREPILFAKLIENMQEEGSFVFADVSPTASLAGFIRWGFDNRLPVSFAINQYGHNLESVAKMISDVGGHTGSRPETRLGRT